VSSTIYWAVPDVLSPTVTKLHDKKKTEQAPSANVFCFYNTSFLHICFRKQMQRDVILNFVS
jgi:hypothetical protein